jgi:hypothetical protein
MHLRDSFSTILAGIFLTSVTLGNVVGVTFKDCVAAADELPAAA